MLLWNEDTQWGPLLEAAVRADKLGYDSLWAWGQRTLGRTRRDTGRRAKRRPILERPGRTERRER
jgi:hypothetical protein